MIRFAVFALLASLLACTGCKKPPDDKTLAQGEWMVVDVDLPGDTHPGERKEMEEMKELSVVVQGDRVRITHPREKGSLSATFLLDQTKMPREIDVIDLVVTGDGERETQANSTTRGIYQLTGDELVIALPLGDGKNLPRPTEFKALADKVNHQGVLVFHLKKRK